MGDFVGLRMAAPIASAGTRRSSGYWSAWAGPQLSTLAVTSRGWPDYAKAESKDAFKC